MFCKYNILYLFVALFFATNVCWSQANIPPTLSALGIQAYCPLSQINIVTDFDIVDPDDTEIEALYVQISTGYVSGEDTLILSGSHPNIAASWNVLEGKLTLEGASSVLVSYTDLIAAVKDVVFQSTNISPTDKFFSFTIGDANYLPSTGHFYEYVPNIGITWANARTAAQARTYFGLEGYLATITSPEEAQLSGEQAAGAGWVGGSDAGTEGVWQWVTGPENGTVFWNGGIGGTSPNYANWNNNEPNNAGNEDYAHVTAPGVGLPGSWNDLTNTGENSGDYQPKGYIVEYGGMPSDIPLNISASTSIVTTEINSATGDIICEGESATLQALATIGDVYWFSSSNASDVIPISIGTSFTTPILTTSTTYYALASVNGCTDGSRIAVQATVNSKPIITSTTGNTVCESTTGALSAVASSGVINWYDSLTGGTLVNTGTTYTPPVLSSTTTYYVDATENGCVSDTRSSVTLTVQTVPVPTANNLQEFCDVDEAKISDLIATGSNVLWYNANTGGSPFTDTDILTSSIYYASQTINGCESLARLAVNVEIYDTVEPISSTPNSSECDSDLDGDNANGFKIFDLTVNELDILNGKSISDFTFSYYTDAAYSDLIPNSSSFTNTIQEGQTIYVRVENSLNSGCYTDTFFEINVLPLPVIQTSITFQNCDEDGVSDGFTDFNLNEIDDIITFNNSAGVNISYHLYSIDAETNTDAINPDVFNNADAIANTIYARVENATTGCFIVSTINLQVSTTLFPSGYNYEFELCDDDDINDGIREFFLADANVSILNQFPTGQNLTVHYYRNLADAQLEQDEISQLINYTNETPFSQNIFVRVESDDNGACFGLGSHVTLAAYPRPEFEIDQSEVFCFDSGFITLSTYNPKGNYTYQWKDENDVVISNLPNAIVNVSGAYTVVATSLEGCESFPFTFDVVESAEALIDMDDITVVELADNNSITINNESNNLGIGDYEFALDDEFGNYQDEPIFNNVGAGIHTVYVSDKKGCGVVSIEVFVLGFPKFFTPNGDGENDIWQLKGLSGAYGQASKVTIYDRYGKLIKQIDPRGNGWNGTFNGNLLPTSDYWFVVELIDLNGSIKTYRGHFSLVR